MHRFRRLPRGVTTDHQSVQLSLMKISIAEKDAKQLMRIIKNTSVDVNGQDEHGFRPLHYAAKRGSVDALRILIENGADVNCLSADGRSPLVYAVNAGYFDAASYLISSGSETGCIVNGMQTAGTV